MSDMPETPIEQTPVEAPATESLPTFHGAIDMIMSASTPGKKKRGRKPKVATPAPPPVVVATPAKPRKRRSAPAKLSKGDRALAAAVESAKLDRIKVIDELSKIKISLGTKQVHMEALDWKISMLTGAPSSPGIPLPPAGTSGYPLPPQYPQPPAYPAPSAPAYMPPGMRTPSLPEVPRANGGAIDTGLEQENEDPDQFLKVGGVIGGSGWK